MEILYLLIPLSAVVVLTILAVFGWALNSGQFEDLECEGERILADEHRQVDAGQTSVASGRQQSADPSKTLK
jgi:cbb3-type cytochrome oxidase maturation protein